MPPQDSGLADAPCRCRSCPSKGLGCWAVGVSVGEPVATLSPGQNSSLRTEGRAAEAGVQEPCPLGSPFSPRPGAAPPSRQERGAQARRPACRSYVGAHPWRTPPRGRRAGRPGEGRPTGGSGIRGDGGRRSPLKTLCTGRCGRSVRHIPPQGEFHPVTLGTSVALCPAHPRSSARSSEGANRAGPGPGQARAGPESHRGRRHVSGAVWELGWSRGLLARCTVQAGGSLVPGGCTLMSGTCHLPVDTASERTETTEGGDFPARVS